MTSYRRAQFEGGYYFFTVVTYKRQTFLTEQLARTCLRAAWEETRRQSYFEVVALCLLPDHIHCIWKLPEDDRDFSLRWSRIKTGFTRRYLHCGGEECIQSRSRNHKRERGIWQRRFWEHQIRDIEDLHRHVDYVHYNPVKHGLVEQVEDWPWSTYHRYVRDGIYPSRPLHNIQIEYEELLTGH